MKENNGNNKRGEEAQINNRTIYQCNHIRMGTKGKEQLPLSDPLQGEDLVKAKMRKIIAFEALNSVTEEGDILEINL